MSEPKFKVGEKLLYAYRFNDSLTYAIEVRVLAVRGDKVKVCLPFRVDPVWVKNVLREE